MKDLLIVKERKEVKKKTKKSIPLILSGILIFSSIAYTPVNAKADTPAISDNGTTYVTVHIHRELTADEYQQIIDSGGDPSHFTDNTFSIDDLIKAGAVIPTGESIVSAEVTNSTNGQARVMSTSDSGLTIGTWGGNVEPDMNDLQFSWAHIKHYYNFLADSSTLIGQDDYQMKPRTLGYNQLIMQISNPPGINSILKNPNEDVTIDGTTDNKGWQVATFDAASIDQAKTSITYKKDGMPAILLNPDKDYTSPQGYVSDQGKYFVNDAPPTWSNTEGSDNVNYKSWIQKTSDGDYQFGNGKQISNMEVYPQFDFYLMTEGETAASRYDTNYAALYFPLHKESDGEYLYLGDPNSNNVPIELIGHDYNNWIPTTLAGQISPFGSEYDLRRDPNAGMYYQVQPDGQWGSNGWYFLRYVYDETTGQYIDLNSIKRPDGSSPQIIYGPDGKPNAQIIGASYILLPPQYKGHKIKAFVYNTDVGFDFGIDVRVMKPNKYIFDTDVTIKITYSNGNGIVITKTVDRPFINTGESDYYEVTVKNTSDKPVDNVVVTDQMPQGLKYVSIDPSIGYYSGYMWYIGTLEPNQTAILRANVIAVSNGEYVNSAVVNDKAASATIFVGDYQATGNLTVSEIHTFDQNNHDTAIISTPQDVHIAVDTKSLYQFHGTATARLYINHNLVSTQTVNYDPFDEKPVDFGSYYLTGTELITATIDYNNPVYQGDNDGSKAGEMFHDTDNDRLLKETQYKDNILNKQLEGGQQEVSGGTLDVKFDFTGTTKNPYNNMDEAMVGDSIGTVNYTEDSNWVYDRYIVESLNHYVANSSPWGTHQENPTSHKVLVDPEVASYTDNFNWYLPTSPYPGGPLNQPTVSFTALPITQGSGGSSTNYWTDYYQWNVITGSYINSWWEDHGYWETEYYSWTDSDGNTHYGSYEVWHPVPVKVSSSPITYQDLGNPEYTSTGVINYPVSWGQINLLPVSGKRYDDDHYNIESYSYDMWVTLTDWDYYKNQMYWAGIPQHFGMDKKPLRVYYNNAPVAYFSIVGDVNGVNKNNKIMLQDLSYDPDFDPIVAWKWDIDGNIFTDKTAAENYLNTVVVNQPGYHLIKLSVEDNPTGRYSRLKARWSDVYMKTLQIYPENNSPVSYKAQITFDRDVVYTLWHPSVPSIAIDSERHSFLKVHVKVTDIGYWTYEYGVNGEKILRFVPLDLTKVDEPETLVVRYKDAGRQTITPKYIKNLKQDKNSFEYDAYFEYPKAGQIDLNDIYYANQGISPYTKDTKMIFPFEVEKYGKVDTLVKDNVAINAFDPTFANPPGPDVTYFERIHGLGISRVDHYLLKDNKLYLTMQPDPLMQPVPFIGRKDTQIDNKLEYDVDHQVYPY